MRAFYLIGIVIIVVLLVFAIIFGFSKNVNTKDPVHILSLNRQEKIQFLQSFDQVVSDCDGK